MQAQIRQAEARDITTLARYEAEISRISFGEEAITEESFHAKRLQKAMTQTPEGMFVLEDSGQIKGWLWMDIKSNYLTQEKYVNFRSFYIAEALRGGTAAEELLSKGMAYGIEAGATQIVGKVHASNLSMRAIYKQAGFEATHITMEYRVPRLREEKDSLSGEQN